MAAELSEFLLITEVAHGKPLAQAIFERKYRADAPEHGHHIFALYHQDGNWRPASYINYLPHSDAMLVGGACTDGRILRSMTKPQQEVLESAGGLMLQLVQYAEARFSESSVGTFGHCGDERSWLVLERCGYRRLDHPHLIVRWNREPAPAAREELIASVAALGPF